jgi:flagellar hook protein FlgE
MFEVAISGLQAATTDLSVIGNNVANAGSTGFKSSRAQFADVYAANSSSSNAVGLGTKVAGVDQLFTQGALNLTNNTLDLAIDDKGFFGLSDRGAKVYTRAGAFNTDANGYIVNSGGQRLQGYVADGLGGVSGQAGDLRIDTSIAAPQATGNVELAVSLDNTDEPSEPDPWTTDFLFGGTAPVASSYNSSTSTSIYDSLGNSHTLTLYFASTDPVSIGGVDNKAWNVYAVVDNETVRPLLTDAGGSPIPTPPGTPAGTLVFDNFGQLIPASSSSPLEINNWQPQSPTGGSNGALIQDFIIDFTDTDMIGTFKVNKTSQDGATAGQLNRIGIDDSGTITAFYSNNETKSLGRVALYDFANPQGLKQIGSTAWVESPESGPAQMGAAGTGSLGSIQSGTLEQSNVDVAGELVDLILAQRNYQANAQTIQAADKVTQTILNIR